MRAALLALPLLLAGCTPMAWQSGLDTAGMVVDTAAVVRARQLGLCGAAPSRSLATAEDVLELQEQVDALQRDLAEMQRRLARAAVERARNGGAYATPQP